MPLDPQLEQKLAALEERSQQLSEELAEPDITADMDRYRTT
ncbi:MAG: peptide chain release factor 1, partial [Gammaproteobacteria bacterium]|nr:peptide chain release factor 1 [Gammaproteobacteria bacterium]